MKSTLNALAFFLSVSFQMLNAQKIVLIEQFTNSGCPPCAVSSPPVFDFAANNPAKVLAIAYHTSFPYSDSMYFENPVESNARVAYYGVVTVPFSVVDGNYYQNISSAFLPVMTNTINARANTTEKYAITSLKTALTGSLLESDLLFESLDSTIINDSLIAQVVVTEENVLKSSYAASPGANSETEYKYVMRKMLPDQHGTLLLNKGLGQKDTLHLHWTLQKIKSISQLRVVVFVQNKNTKEVYNARVFSPDQVVGLREEKMDASFLNVFPNPFNGELQIFLSADVKGFSFTITDILGKSLYTDWLENQSVLKLDLSFLPKGIYTLHGSDGKRFVTKKIIKE